MGSSKMKQHLLLKTNLARWLPLLGLPQWPCSQVGHLWGDLPHQIAGWTHPVNHLALVGHMGPFLWKSSQISRGSPVLSWWDFRHKSGLTSTGRVPCALQKQDGSRDGFIQLSGGTDRLTDGPLVSMATEEATPSKEVTLRNLAWKAKFRFILEGPMCAEGCFGV